MPVGLADSAGVNFGAAIWLLSDLLSRISISRTAERYSSSLRLSVAPSLPRREVASSPTTSRIDLRMLSRFLREAEVSPEEAKRRSKTCLGSFSLAIGVDSLRQERLLE